jgi:ubiquinone/menaquinone biosynthesis C-methylase UbiE
MANPSESWEAGHPWATVYDFFVERAPLARVAGRLAFGTDTRLLYRTIEAVGELADGSAVLDIPVGGGVALRGLPRGRDRGIRYVAADISPEMLERTRRVARERGVEDQVEIVRADVEQLPFADGEFDLCLSLAGLHCFPHPEAAVHEIARVVKPGGSFAGSVFLTGTGLRYVPGIVGGRMIGVMGPSGSREDLDRWLHDTGFRAVRIEVSGAIGYFSATKPSR